MIDTRTADNVEAKTEVNLFYHSVILLYVTEENYHRCLNSLIYFVSVDSTNSEKIAYP